VAFFQNAIVPAGGTLAANYQVREFGTFPREEQLSDKLSDLPVCGARSAMRQRRDQVHRVSEMSFDINNFFCAPQQPMRSPLITKEQVLSQKGCR
jgi:hypothetical protein